MHSQTRAAVIRYVLPVLAAAQFGCPLQQRITVLDVPVAAIDRLKTGVEMELRRAGDDPDEARDFYLAKRVGPGGIEIDVVAESLRALRHMDQMPRYSTRARKALHSRAEARRARSTGTLAKAELLTTWESVGPGNIGGRTRALLVDPYNPQIMFAAGVSGGIWKTEDGGAYWRPLDDLLPSIAVSSMAMDPSDSRILYAGTGEGYFREVVRGTALPLRGEGILKTEDGGESWARLPATSTSDFYWVNDLVVSRNDALRVYAATRTGVWRSTDGGNNWRRILNAENVTGGCLDLALRPDLSNDYLFATCGTFEQATVYLNERTELDAAWTPVLSEYGMGRTSLAISPSNPDIIYALSTSYVPGPDSRFDGGLHAVFRSDEGGKSGTWRATLRNTNATKLNTLLLTNPIAASYNTCFGGTDSYSTLGWYTNVIAVDPANPQIVFAGGVDLFRSDDGGSNWGPVSYWAECPPSAHADQHVIVFHHGYDGAGNQTMYLGGDGGVWRTDNARAPRSTAANAPCKRTNSQVVWTSLNHNYGVTQFYHGAPFPDGKSYLGGTQDNGTILGSDTNGVDGWRPILGGDGGYVAVDFNNPNIVYAEYQYLSLSKSTDGGLTLKRATTGITEPGNGTLFIAPYVMDPGNSNRLWLGGRSIWRTDDGASSWVQAGQQLSPTAKVSAIAVAPSNPDRVLVGMNNGSIFRQTQATNSSATTAWPSVQPRPGYVTSLAFDPADDRIAYATYAEFGGHHVWKTIDGGETWIPIDGEGIAALPDLPVHCLVVDPNHRERLYLGTDLGVLSTRQGGSVWAVEDSGFANAVTEWLSLQQRDGADPVLWAFTHGRGAWRVTLAADPAAQPCTPERWIPHVTPGGNLYQTTLFATNFSAVEAQVTLVPFQQDGTRLEPVNLTVQPGKSYMQSADEVFAHAALSHIGICGSPSVAVTAAYRSTTALSTSAHVTEVTAPGTQFFLYPGEWDLVYEGMALVNVGEEPSRVEAVSLDEAGTELRRIVLNPALVPFAKQLAVLDWEFRDFRGASIRIECSQPASLLFIRGTKAGMGIDLLYRILPVIPGKESTTPPGVCAPQRWTLHLTPPDAGYDTTILATNARGADDLLELVPFLADGTRLDSVTRILPAGSTLISLAQELFPVLVSHFGVCSPQTLRLTSGYHHNSGLGATAHVPEIPVVDTQFLFYPGEWSIVYEGMAVVNHGTESESVDAVLLDSAGEGIHRVRLTGNLAPGAKHLAVLDAVFAGYQGVAIRIECSQPSSLLLLRGTKPGLEPRVLFQTVPIAITPRR